MRTELLCSFNAMPLTLEKTLYNFGFELLNSGGAKIPITKTGPIRKGALLLLSGDRCQPPQPDSTQDDRYEIHEVREEFEGTDCMTIVRL